MEIKVVERPKPRVLVVDDELANREVLQALLQGEGYEVVLACNGQDALGKVSQDIGLILMDVNMPVMGGIAACKALQTNPATAQIPLIFLSGRNDTKTIGDSLCAGAYDFLFKPISPQKLFIKIGAIARLKKSPVPVQRFEDYMKAVRKEAEVQERVAETDPTPAENWSRAVDRFPESTAVSKPEPDGPLSEA